MHGSGMSDQLESRDVEFDISFNVNQHHRGALVLAILLSGWTPLFGTNVGKLDRRPLSFIAQAKPDLALGDYSTSLFRCCSIKCTLAIQFNGMAMPPPTID